MKGCEYDRISWWGFALVLISAAITVGCSASSGTKNVEVMEVTEGPVNLTTAEVRADPDRMICRRSHPTGSRISEKICMTARQWQQLEDDSQRALDTLTRAPQQQEDL
jgi:hypothetical protein